MCCCICCPSSFTPGILARDYRCFPKIEPSLFFFFLLLFNEASPPFLACWTTNVCEGRNGAVRRNESEVEVRCSSFAFVFSLPLQPKKRRKKKKRRGLPFFVVVVVFLLLFLISLLFSFCLNYLFPMRPRLVQPCFLSCFQHTQKHNRRRFILVTLHTRYSPSLSLTA